MQTFPDCMSQSININNVYLIYSFHSLFNSTNCLLKIKNSAFRYIRSGISLVSHFILTLIFELTDVSAGCVFLMFGRNSALFSKK